MSQHSSISPPKYLSRFLRWFCNPELIEDVEGDLSELFSARFKQNKRMARWQYFRDVMMLFRPGIIRNVELKNGLINTAMLRNYLKSTMRNLVKYKAFSTINIFSLSIGIAACLVIFLFVKDERSFDGIHQENVYRLCEVQSFPGTNTQKVALSMPGMGPTMIQEFP